MLGMVPIKPFFDGSICDSSETVQMVQVSGGLIWTVGDTFKIKPFTDGWWMVPSKTF